MPMFVCKRGAGRPSRAEAAAIDDAILDCARRVFCRQGFAGAAVDEIAAECQVTKHTIYRRYPGKLTLLNAVIERDLARLRGTTAACCGDDPLSAVRTIAKRCYDFSIAPENVAFFSFLEAEAHYSGEVRDHFKRWHGQAIAPIVVQIERAQRGGDLPPGNAVHFCETLLDLIDGPCRRLQLDRDDVFHGQSPDEFFAARWELFLNAMSGLSTTNIAG